MDVYLPQANYIKKEETEYGVGILMSINEERAKIMTARKKNVSSHNQWLSAVVPDESFFLRMDVPVCQQTKSIVDGLHQDTFLFTLYITEARNTYDKANDDVVGMSNDEARGFIKKRMNELADEKFNMIIQLTGLELVQLVNSRCRDHDMAKSSALLYDAGIKGVIVPQTDNQDFIIFNPHVDMHNVFPRNAILSNSKLVF